MGLEKMETTKIELYRRFGNMLTSREQANSICTSFPDPPCEVVLDFSNINFMSRSFADQFYKSSHRPNNNVQVITVNTNQQVAAMLKAVTKTQGLGKIAAPTFTIRTLTDRRELKKYLRSIG